MSSPHNGSGYYGLNEKVNDSLTKDHFKSRLNSGGDLAVEFARTGYLGFMLKSERANTLGGMITLRISRMYTFILFKSNFSLLSEPVCCGLTR